MSAARTDTARRAGSAGRRAAIGFRWRPRTRKLWLIAHIVASLGWIGADIALGALVFTWMMAPSPYLSGAAAAAIAMVAGWPITFLAVAALATGILLGLGTRHGVLTHWWVVIKLAINVVLLVLVIVLLVPATLELQQDAIESLRAGRAPLVDTRLYMPPLVSGTALLIATALSVFKPFGPLRRRSAPEGSAGGRMAT